jgi:hypothetical protein
MFIDVPSLSRSYSSPSISYFAPLALALGEGDAAGEGLAAGLGVAEAVAPLDEAGEGLAVFGEVELLAGSQPAANPIEEIVRSRSAVRLIRFIFVVLISFGLGRARLKSGIIIARWLISSNGRSHRSFGGISGSRAPKPSFSKRGLHD